MKKKVIPKTIQIMYVQTGKNKSKCAIISNI